MKRHQNKIIIGSILVIIGCFLVLCWPFYVQHQCQTRVWSDLEKQAKEVCPAVIAIIPEWQEDGITTFGAGATGVLFMQKGDRYYALTADHVVNGDGVTFRASTAETGYKPREFATYPKLRVECRGVDSDLAVVSFRSEEKLGTVSVSAALPAKGDRIVVIGGPQTAEYRITYGQIRSSSPEEFDPGDGLTNQVLKHNAYETAGSSGSPVLDEDMELVGINIGGGRNFLGCFRYGVMIGQDQILEFLKESGLQ